MVTEHTAVGVYVGGQTFVTNAGRVLGSMTSAAESGHSYMP